MNQITVDAFERNPKISAVGWGWVLLAGAAVAVLTYVSLMVVGAFYGLVLWFVAEGQASYDQQLDRFVEIMAVWGTPVMLSLLTIPAAAWVVRKAGTAAVVHGVLVGLVSAIGVEAVGLIFGLPSLGELVRSFVTLGAGWLGGTVGQAVLLRKRRRLAADLQHSRELLVKAREEERRRLRRDLHDGLGPQLAALTLGLDAARNLLVADDPKNAEALLNRLKGQTQEAIADIRRLVHGLRPPALDELGLISAIHEQAAKHGYLLGGANGKDGQPKKDGLSFSMEAPQILPPLPAAVEVACYRIAQEAITNVSRHAKARTCRVRLSLEEAENELELEITDDGVGLSAERHAGVGTSSMGERAQELGGSCAIEPGPMGGTRVLARLPLPAASPSLPPASPLEEETS